MPSFKTKRTDNQGRAIYQDICYPISKEFRKKLYDEIMKSYEREKEKQETQTRDSAERKEEKTAREASAEKERENTPFR